MKSSDGCLEGVDFVAEAEECGEVDNAVEDSGEAVAGLVDLEDVADHPDRVPFKAAEDEADQEVAPMSVTTAERRGTGSESALTCSLGSPTRCPMTTTITTTRKTTTNPGQ